jgi:hypothetical protein
MSPDLAKCPLAGAGVGVRQKFPPAVTHGFLSLLLVLEVAVWCPANPAGCLTGLSSQPIGSPLGSVKKKKI